MSGPARRTAPPTSETRPTPQAAREGIGYAAAGSRGGAGPQGGPHQRHRDRDRSLQDHRGRWLLVGRRRAGGVGAPEGTRRPQGLREIRHIAARWRVESMSVRFGVNPIGWSNDDLRELGGKTPLRSEEHTSELQSLAYLVCRLLLEKKK